MNDPNSQVHLADAHNNGKVTRFPSQERDDERFRRAVEQAPVERRLSPLEKLELIAEWKRGAVLLVALLTAVAIVVVVLDWLVGALE